MNRFYSEASYGPAVSGGWTILLDSRPVRTPNKHQLICQSEALAQLIVSEWADQGSTIIPDTMPMTQLATTTCDRVVPYRAEIEQRTLSYIQADLLCYRADEPEGLAQEQTKLWSPWLHWFSQKFGITLNTSVHLAHIDQPQAATSIMETYIKGLDVDALTTFQLVTSHTGSIVLACAFLSGDATPDICFNCALCEELYYDRTLPLEQYGLDPTEALRRATLRADLEAARLYLDATRQG